MNPLEKKHTGTDTSTRRNSGDEGMKNVGDTLSNLPFPVAQEGKGQAHNTGMSSGGKQELRGQPPDVGAQAGTGTRKVSGTNAVAQTSDAYAVVVKDLELLSGANPILRGLSMAVPRGTVLGILGESGAGKTTLLRLLARKLNESVLTINGVGKLPDEIWYIAQEDVLYEFDTPRRAVVFLHELLYGEGSEAAQQAAVEYLQRVRFPMELIDRPIESMDNGLSVGTRRLLNVALGLCSKAKVILLDEPTTGLDSTTATNLVSVLKEVCSTMGCTAICTIHQPSDETLSYFDDLSVMSEGRAYVHGPEPLPVDPTYSQAELLLRRMKDGLLTPATLPPWPPHVEEDLLGKSSFADQLGQLDSAHIPFGRQFKVLLLRFWHRNWHNFFSIRFRFLIVLGLAIIIGACLWQIPYDDPRSIRDVLGIGMAVIGTTFVPIVISAGFFPSEKPSLLNEMSQSKRFDIAPYMLGRSLFDMFVALLCSPASLVFGGMVGIQGYWARWWFTILLQAWCSDSFGFMLSVRFPPEIAIPALIPAAGFFSVLIGTAVAAPAMEGAGWIFHGAKWLSYFKYGFAGLMADQLSLMTGSCAPGTDRCSYANWEHAMDKLGLDRESEDGFVGSYGFQWLMLASFVLFHRLVAYFLLRGLVASAKYTYKASTSWEAKKAADKAREERERQHDGSVEATVPSPEGSEGKELHPPSKKAAILALVHVVADPPAIDQQQVASGADEGVPMVPVVPAANLTVTKSFISQTERACEFELQWKVHVVAERRVSLFGKQEATLLHPQTGKARSGQVLGILGPAASGKTALLKTLSCQLPILGYRSDLSVVDVSCAFTENLTLENFDPCTRFVYQNDMFVPGDTVSASVHRQLAFAMKDDPSTFDDNVSSILTVTGLSHVADKKAAEISGGQLRRLSIACQLAHRPAIMLLDEPTSGLDSELALEAMSALRRFARTANGIVICTLNQPGKRILPVVDRFLFLSEGHAVFHGSLAEAIGHFNVEPKELQSRSVTDVILDRLRHVSWPHSSTADSTAPLFVNEDGTNEVIPADRSDATDGKDPSAVEQELLQVVSKEYSFGDAAGGGEVPFAASVCSSSVVSPTNTDLERGELEATTVTPRTEEEVEIGVLQMIVPPDEGPRAPRRVPTMFPHSVRLESHSAKGHGDKQGFGPFWTRLMLLIRRHALSRLSSPPQYLLEQLVKFVGFPLVTAVLFIQIDDPYLVNRMGIVFVLSSAMGFIAFMSPIVLFSLERGTFDRETKAGDYHPLTYQLSRWLFESPAEIVFSVLGSIVIYYIVGFEGNLGVFIGVNVLNYLASYGVGSALATLPFSVSVNGGFAAFLIITFMLAEDLVVTPYQISRTIILYPVEVLCPMRHTVIVQMLSESQGSAALLGSLGLDRVLDTEGMAWGLLALDFVLYRLLALAVAWLYVSIDRWRVQRMHR